MRFKILGGLVLTLVFICIILLAGGLDWFRGWVYLGLLIVGRTIGIRYIERKDPELLRRRGQIAQNHWSKMPVWLWLIGAVLYVFFVVVITWAMAVNTHFEKTVRIQRDRHHRVIESGPYRIVRHPGYLGTILGLYQFAF